MTKSILLFSGLVVSSLGIAAPVDCIPLKGRMHAAQVISVKGGDTATVKLNTTGQHVKVWFYGADTPEAEWAGTWPAQAYSEEATAFTTGELQHQRVTVYFNGEGSFSHCYGEIFLNGKSHSLALVGGGYAWWHEHFAPTRDDLRLAQEDAQAGKRGLWSQLNPAAPWDYRKHYTLNPVGPFAIKEK